MDSDGERKERFFSCETMLQKSDVRKAKMGQVLAKKLKNSIYTKANIFARENMSAIRLQRLGFSLARQRVTGLKTKMYYGLLFDPETKLVPQARRIFFWKLMDTYSTDWARKGRLAHAWGRKN